MVGTYVLVSLSRPFEDPVLIFALAMCIFLIAPLLLERFKIPGIVGVMVFGALVGPNALGLLARDDAIILLGEIGIVYLMFVAGLEIDVNEFLENPDRSVLFGLTSFLLPMALGVAVGVSVLGFEMPAAALFAATFASHTLLAYPIIDRLDLATNEAITTTISGTIVTDTLALLVLAVVIRSLEGSLELLFFGQLVVGLVTLFAGVWFIGPKLARWFFRNVDEESYFEFLFVMAVLFTSAFAAELAQVEAIIGAFLAGLSLNRLIPRSGTLMNRIEFVGNALFIPFFLLSVGMLVDVSVFTEGVQAWLVAGSIIVVLFVTKLVAAWGIARVYDYAREEWLTMFGLSSGQAAATLAITLIGFDVGLFGETVVNGVVLMIMIVGVASPAITSHFGRAVVDLKDDSEYDPDDATERVLVSLTDEDEMELLVDLAMLLRGEAEDPLYAMTAVSNRSGDTEAAVAEAESVLESAEEHANAAEVPVDTHTPVDSSTVRGTVRTIEENRITIVVVGWTDRRRFGDRVFGDTVDQLLERTDELLVVSRLTDPFEAVDRLTLVLPGRLAAHPEFFHGVHVMKALAEQLGATVRCLLLDGDPETYEDLISRVEPDVSLEVETVDRAGIDAEETDLLVALLPREGARGWQPGLRSVPDRVRTATDGNVLVGYLSEEPSDSRQFLRVR
ncbi:cation:proton antiporter [Halorubrum sp. AD140]|uniref:cation:proton antiporter n=1 Tax=Halorubrum sp. AD140 TaxID=3050073 RepID=UPI002ACC5BA2|nr:cation:proton antiporter [Halorubrum sp. AD140]MDZ5812072.1 cation:proton antiporter [Halorubrum sp. AD140]